LESPKSATPFSRVSERLVSDGEEEEEEEEYPFLDLVIFGFLCDTNEEEQEAKC